MFCLVPAQKSWRLILTWVLVTADVDGGGGRAFHNADRCYREAGTGGQLSAPQPHRRTDVRYLVGNDIRRTSFLRSARCIEGKNIRE